MRMILIAIAAAFTLSACNTIEGVGRDVQGAGEVLEKGARKTKNAITD